MRHIRLGSIGLALVITLSGCINEDNEDCEVDFTARYDMHLVTNEGTELNTVLGAEADIYARQALSNHLRDIFSDYGRDLRLAFYDAEASTALQRADEHEMNATSATYAMRLSPHAYLHTALANVRDSGPVSVTGGSDSATHALSQQDADTVPSHGTGLFTARLPMRLATSKGQTFDVSLYMANCSAALVVDTVRCATMTGMRVASTGFATSMTVADSLYHFAQKFPMVRAPRVAVDDGAEQVYCSVSFPSRDPAGTRVVTETTAPFEADEAESVLWQVHAYVSLADGTVTQTILSLKKPLRAGQLKIIKGYVDESGAVRTDDMEVAVSVQLEWAPGISQEVPLG